MKPFCEIIVSDILPALRALITQELIQKHGFNQTETAKKLGITQPAVSQYAKEMRGAKIKLLQADKDVMKAIKILAFEIASGKVKTIKIQEIFCEICKKIRKEKLICKMHENIYPAIRSCKLCFGSADCYSK